MSVKVRGIYSTAITKLLKEKKHDIVSPSKIAKERMDLKDDKQADTLIYNKEDLNGIIIHGKQSEKIIDELKKELGELFIKKVETGDIYRGIIQNLDMKDKEIIVDLGLDKPGTLSLKEYWGYLKEGQPILVQIKGKNRENYLLSCYLRLFGENLVLIKNGFTKPSKHIRDRDEMERLMEIGKEAKAKGWGVLWKSLAEGKPESELKEEINRLMEEETEVKKLFESDSKPKLLKTGFCIYFIDFQKGTKDALDKIRSKVTKTVEGHHFLKSGGYTYLADFADKISDKNAKQKIDEVIEQNICEGNFYKILHKKMNGDTKAMFGKVAEKDGKSIKITRKMRYRGNYDGLNVEIKEGDYAISTVVPGREYITHEYYSKNGTLIGKFFSINTPIEVYPHFARYIDLEIDVVEKDGKREIIDSEELMNSELSEKSKKYAMKLAKKIQKGDNNE